jgi:hypothetical protein
MRVRRDGWRRDGGRDGGRFMRSRVVVVVGVVLLEPSLFVDFAYDVPLDLVCRGVVQHSKCPGEVEYSFRAMSGRWSQVLRAWWRSSFGSRQRGQSQLGNRKDMWDLLGTRCA